METRLTASRLRAFAAVADEGGYAAAARRLGISQPAVSQAVQDLERAFGVRLFERRGRGVVPTELCLELAPIAAEIQRLEDAAVRLLQRGEQLESGTLRVGLGNSMPGMALIGEFQRRLPTLQVQVEFGNFSTIIDAVLEQRVDVGLLPNLPTDRRFHRKVCLVQEVVALAPAGHPFAGRAAVRLRDLATERLIFRSAGSSTQRVVDRAFRAAGLAPRPAMVLETRDGVCEAVANGLGVGFIWRHGTSRADGVHRVRVAEMSETFEEVLFRRADMRNPIVDMFFDATDGATLGAG